MTNILTVGEPVDGAWPWDGRDAPYVPRDPLRVNGVTLHREAAVELDPITFEVISARLWNINEEHAETIKRVSGSPVVVYANDFNACIQTEVGDSFLFAPYIQYFTANAEYIIKYTLEARAKSPGIHDGDVFVHNDPLVAGSHQQDVGVYAPLFVDGELFCWVFNAAHVRDIGGTEPGSFCLDAPDIYHDPPPIRALTLADRNGIRADTEDQLLRFSRVPHLLALELRSQLAGIARARQRLTELIERYGPDTVKAVMRKLIDDTDAAMARKLRDLPDGSWREVNYSSGSVPGDRQVHKVVLNVHKRGDELIFTNEGTDPQTGSINCGYGQWRSSITSAVASLMAYEHRYCAAGVLRRLRFLGQLGTITCIDRDGAVSALHAQHLTTSMATKLISRILFCDPAQRSNVLNGNGVSTCGHMTHYGTDQRGNPFATVTLDEAAASLGGSAFRDGIDQGGTNFWPASEIGDCEATEKYFPVLYLYRRGGANAGHGKFRGGNGIAWAFVGQGAVDQRWSAISMAASLPTASGLFGGLTAGTNWFYGAQDTDIRERMARGELPTSSQEIAALDGRGGPLASKAKDLPLLDTDIAECAVYGSGGYGDPLERAVELIEDDLRSGAIDVVTAEHIYGARLDASGSIDGELTLRYRDELRSGRLAAAVAPQDPPLPARAANGSRILLQVAERLALTMDAGAAWWACTGCGQMLGAAEQNYKRGAARLDRELHEIDSHRFPRFADEVDVSMAYRAWMCPSCGVTLEQELVRSDDPPVHDIEIAADWISSRGAAVEGS